MPSYVPAKHDQVDQTCLIVHVIPKVTIESLDERDLDDDGNCIVAGRYLIGICDAATNSQPVRDQVLEIFNALDVISDIDDYHLLVSTYNASMDSRLVADLGVWLGTSKLPRCFTHLDLESRCA